MSGPFNDLFVQVKRLDSLFNLLSLSVRLLYNNLAHMSAFYRRTFIITLYLVNQEPPIVKHLELALDLRVKFLLIFVWINVNGLLLFVFIVH